MRPYDQNTIIFRWEELKGIDTFTHPGAWHCHRTAYNRMRDHDPELGDVAADDRRYRPDADGCVCVVTVGCDLGCTRDSVA